ncbi:hypothetical protein SynBIOSE41_01222 [Synechococcus sp. BIOS-E4-1]|nr:hypothetical protein SynBIOSE41_01222 [Synechococcus sp. BIOS-E4-1]
MSRLCGSAPSFDPDGQSDQAVAWDASFCLSLPLSSNEFLIVLSSQHRASDKRLR